ncbi:M15 family metallopeptidase [Streptomyces sp. NPDC004667]|uniref:M15 family metallopeptidase n=1 Tax=Streptomyces sp. NPDC004667 TaxID=3154285 RepID=UPI0033B6D5ED
MWTLHGKSPGRRGATRRDIDGNARGLVRRVVNGSRTWRVTANYHLWRVGLRPLLPNYYIRHVPVRESGEPLIDLGDGPFGIDGRISVDQRARSSVANALREANSFLPQGNQLLVVEAFRSRERQEELWELARKKVQAENPLARPEEIRRLTGLLVADPSQGSVNGHQTGGAIDLTLADRSGRELWMGTEVQEFTPATATKARVPQEVGRRRSVLVHAMTRAGFVNYPAEWWHFSMGDRLWAAYSRQPYARYGEAKE